MTDKLLKELSEIATQAHTRIQQDFAQIDPIVGVSRSMRKNGVPADAMTIDCLKSKKRIIIILHDLEPDILHYQLSFIDKDPAEEFASLAFKDLTSELLYDWIKNYFS
ncbi:MAG: hypothetical protein ACI843_000504 [Psychrobacter glaciei]